DGFDRWTSQRAICQAWDLPPQPPAADHVVRSDIPTLVMAGSFDPITPPSWSRATADNLVNSTYVEFPGHGHSIGSANPCAAQLEAAFLDDPAARLDTGCVATTPGPSFVLPDEIYMAPGLARSGQEVSLGEPQGVAWIETVFAAGFIATMVALLGLLALGLRSLVFHHGEGWGGEASLIVAFGLAVLLALGVLALPAVLTEVNNRYANMSSLAVRIGPSRDLPATILAWLAPGLALAAVAVLLLSARAWITRRWTSSSRIVITFTALAALPILLLGLRWDIYTML
ncbi:MAG: alpha/beta hydrolase, partial [Acidimicrobiia bacterium]|nr:alpha/beta hydrolase [Acidimicrobiia bacterium]